MTEQRTVLVPRERVVRWFENFEERHGGAMLQTVSGALQARAADGASAVARLPFGEPYAGPADASALSACIWSRRRICLSASALASGDNPAFWTLARSSSISSPCTSPSPSSLRICRSCSRR